MFYDFNKSIIEGWPFAGVGKSRSGETVLCKDIAAQIRPAADETTWS